MATRVQAPGGAAPQSDTLVNSRVLTRSPLTSDEFEVDGLEARSPTPSEFSTSAFQENFVGVPVSSGAMPLVQPKLVVGPANDKYEQEADRVADQVMGMPEPVGLVPPGGAMSASQTAPGLQRQLAESESLPDLDDDEDLVQTKALGPPPAISQILGADSQLQRETLDDDDDELVQMKAAGATTAIASPTLTSQLGQGGGHPLPSSTRHFMETRFGHDFGGVRVHSDNQAAQMNRGLNAQAFTHGRDIYFGKGQYQPQTLSGKHLLAHELTHTIQQKPSIIKRFPRSTAPLPIINQRQAANAKDADTTGQPTVQPAPTDSAPIPVGAHIAQPQIALRRDTSPGVAPIFSSETTAPPSSAAGVTNSPSPIDRATLPESESPLSAETAIDTGQINAVSTPSPPQSPEEISAFTETVTNQADDGVPVASTEQPTVLDQEPRSAAPDGQEAEAASVEPLALAGSSDQAMVAFTEASPSQIAATQPSLGTVLDRKIKQEQQTEAANAPVLVAKTSGTVEVGVTPPEPIPSSGEAQINDGVKAADPGELQAEPHENVGAVPSNQANEKLLDRQNDDSFLGWFRNNTKSFLSLIHTRSDVNTNAGKPLNVNLEGEADPNRMNNQRGEAESQLKSQRDATANVFKQHPGQQNIQPKAVNEEKPTQISADAAVSIETAPDSGAMDYANAPMPPEVRTHADELLKPSLEANLATAKVQTQDAANTKERDKAAAISQAEADAVAANQKADNDQRNIVLTNRQAVAKQQQEGIQGAYDEVNEFITEADKEQAINRKEISDQVKEKEGEARKELEKGEEKAEAEKKAKEKEAADKKKELEREQKNDRWWNRAARAVKSAVKAITSAIDTIFTKLREAVKAIIEKAKEAATGLINKARNWVIDKLNKFRDWAKDKVNTYLKDRFPGLAKRINEAIDGVVDTAIKGVNMVADAAIAGVEALANRLTAALDQMLQVFQTALKAAVQIAGAVITGDFAEALRIAVQAACDIAGIDSKPIFDFIDRAASKVMAILKDPKTFFNNVMKAIGGGVRNFSLNIQQHLVKGLIGWLTGALSEVSLSLPATFDAPGILSLVMQILGLTYENIKAKVIKRFPPAARVIAGVEKGITIVRKLIIEGPMALWEEVKQKMSNLKDLVISGIKDFVAKTVVKEGIAWLLGLLTPVGAIAKLLKLIFDFVMFLVTRFEQIKDFVMSVYDSVAAIASGNLSQAMKAVEDALSRSLPVVVSLLASLAGLSGIGKTVKNIIGKVAKPVNKIVDGLIDRMVKFAKKLLRKGKAVGKKAKEKVKAGVSALIEWWKIKKKFRTKDGRSHEIFFRGKGKNAKLAVASQVQLMEGLFNQKQIQISGMKGAQKTLFNENLNQARKHFLDIEDIRNSIELEGNKKKTMQREKRIRSLSKKLEKQLIPLASKLEVIGVGITQESDDVKTQIKPTETGPGGRAKRVVADPLSKFPGNTTGSRPSADPPGWKSHIETIQNYQNFYVRLHIVSEKLHGPGRLWNLTPGKDKENQEMEREAERPAQKLTQQGNVLWYEGTVYYRQTGYTDFAEKINIRFGFKEKDSSGNWNRIKAIKFDKDFPVSEVDPPGSRDPIPTLSNVSQSWLNSKNRPSYLPRNAMRRIIKERGSKAYPSFAAFKGSPEVKAEPGIADLVKLAINEGYLKEK